MAHSADPPPCLNGFSDLFSRCFFALPHDTFQSSFLTDFGLFSAPIWGGTPLWGALGRPKGQHQRGRGPQDRLLIVFGSILGSILEASGHNFRRFFDVFFGIPFRTSFASILGRFWCPFGRYFGLFFGGGGFLDF